MEVKIYLIEDINDLKYVGSTKQKLNIRLSHHKSHNDCSSSKLNLHNCIITELECCDDTNKKEREQYWIDRIDCVNKKNTYFDRKEYNKEYYQNNKEKIKEQKKKYMKEYCEKNKEQRKEYNKEYKKLDWYCCDCKCSVKLCAKSKHLNSQKHQLNINNYIE
jgi:hypothetical protein